VSLLGHRRSEHNRPVYISVDTAGNVHVNLTGVPSNTAYSVQFCQFNEWFYANKGHNLIAEQAIPTPADLGRPAWGDTDTLRAAKAPWRETFVDFEQSLNIAVKKVRDVLCDTADNPTFVETIPGEGYRFIAIVETVLAASDVASVHSESAGNAKKSRAVLTAAAIVTVLVFTAV
jgi:hypothetical protein